MFDPEDDPIGAPVPKHPARARNVPHPADARRARLLERVERPHPRAHHGDDPRDGPVDAALKEEDGLGALDRSTALVNHVDAHSVTNVEGDVVLGVLVLDDDDDGVRDDQVPCKRPVNVEVHDADRLAGDGELRVLDGEDVVLASPVCRRAFKADSHPSDVATSSRDVGAV